MTASWAGHADLARLLLARGADALLQDSAGDSALHVAARGDEAVALALLCAEAPAAAAALALRNKAGLTPRGVASSLGHAGCEALLRMRDAPV